MATQWPPSTILRGVVISGLETAAVNVGKAVAQHAAKEWLRRRRNATERAATLAELAASELTSPLKRGKLDNALEGIGYRAAEQLEPLLATEFRGLSGNNITAAVGLAIEALRETDLSDDAIFAADADPEVLARTIRAQVPDRASRTDLPKAAADLYEFVLDQGCRYLIQVVRQLPAFQPRALAEVLDRLSSLADQMAEILANTPRFGLSAQQGDVSPEAFQAEYFHYLAANLDRLDLLGLSMRQRPRLSLSLAYVSLTVSDQDGHKRRSALDSAQLAERWFGGMRELDGTGNRVEAAIGTAGRTLVLGEAGSGKTTLLDWLAVTAARGGFTDALQDWNGCVPFSVRLRRYVKSELPRPEQFLDHAASWVAGIMPKGWVHQCLRSGRALVLVDGVDEVPAAKRRAVRVWLGELVAMYPDVRVVVTARPAAAEERWLADDGFASVELERMSPRDVRLFLERWHEAAGSSESLPCEPGQLPAAERRLLSLLDARPDLRALAANPLLCAMLCALNLGRTSELPNNRMELYRAALDMLLNLRDAEQGIAGLLDVTAKTVVLSDLAWRLTLANRTELPRDKALELVSHKLLAMSTDERPEKVLDHLLERSGVVRAPVPGRIDFVHRTFQEYLAASEATEERHIDTLVGHAHLDTWRETIVMACGHAKRSQSRELLTAILDRADDEPRHARRLRLLAAACLETVIELDPEIRERIDAVITGRLVPPRSLRETQSLAGVGHRLLRYLPENLNELTEKAAAATVRAAALSNNPEAMTRLSQYAQDQRKAVQEEVVDAWRYFDATRYADEVLAGMRFVERLRIRERWQLPHLRKLQHLKRVYIVIYDTNAIELAEISDIEEIFVACEGSFDLTPLAGHESLTVIDVLADCFTGLPKLARIPKLTELWLAPTKSWRNIAFLRDLPTLRDVDLQTLNAVKDYRPLAGLTNVEVLALSGCAHLTDLSALAALDNLTHLSLSGCADTLDVTALAGKSLSLHLPADNEYRGLEQLGDGVQVHYRKRRS